VAAEVSCQLAQAEAKALDAERRQLLQEMAQDMNKSTLIEQVCCPLLIPGLFAHHVNVDVHVISV
jgi:hypothetical protein